MALGIIAVLLVEDDEEDALLTREALSDLACQQRTGKRFTVNHVTSLAAATEALAASFDVILLDLNLPDAAGLEMVGTIGELAPHTPVVVLTGTTADEIGLQAVQHGAQDFLTKGTFSAGLLCKAIHFAIERKQLHSELEERTAQLAVSEARLNLIVASSVDAIVITDPSGDVLFANPAAEALFCRSQDELLGQSLGLAHHAKTTEIEVTRQNGESCVAEMRSAPIEWHGADAILMSLRDITAHKETLRLLDETKSHELTMRDRFLSQVSHELRTPLTVSQQYADLLLDGLIGEITDDQKDAIAKMHRSGRYLERMIEDLLEATRSDTGKLVVNTERTPLDDLVPEVMAAAKSAMIHKTLVLETVLPSVLPDILADPNRLRQILGNLLGNAVKFTPDGGTVTLTVALRSNHPDQVLFSVRDTGCGIPAAEKDLIFKPLYQRDVDPELSRKGLGLGLHICTQLVQSQRGQIWVESEEGQGSTFLLSLPVFSLRSVLAGIPRRTAAAAEFCVLGVVIQQPNNMRDEQALLNHLNRVRRELSECMMPDRDFLFPRVARDANGEVAFILAAADRQGAEVLAQRIEHQIAESPVIQRARLDIKILIEPVVLAVDPPSRAGKPLDRRQRLADALHPVMQAIADQARVGLDLPYNGRVP